MLLLQSGSGYGILRPGSAIVNPAANEADLLIGQRIASHRHSLAFDLPGDHLDEEALGALSWNDDFAGEPAFEGFRRIESQATHEVFRAVALNAAGGENGLDVFGEFYRSRSR